MLFVHQDAGLGTTPYIRRAEPEMVREIWPESLAVPAMPPGSETGGSF